MSLSHLLQPVPAKDWIIITFLFVGIVFLIGTAEIVRRHFYWHEEFSRKLVHIVVGLLMFFSPILLEASLPLILISAFFTIVNYVAMRSGLLKGMHGKRKTYGTTFYPLSFLILVFFAWEDHKIVIIASMMVLAIGDAAAAIVGGSLTKTHKYMLITEHKSIEGSITMFGVSTLVLFLTVQFYPFNLYLTNTPLIALWIAIITAAVATVAEALSTKGSDNLSVPFLSAIILYFMISHSYQENFQLTIGVILSLIISTVSYHAKFLNKSGAVATFLLAVIIFGFGGWKWAIPILTFFVLSSLLSKVGKIAKSPSEDIFEKGSQRDYAQVLANGGVAGIIMILHMFFGDSQLYLFYLAALAAAMADTWATEIGTLSKRHPRLISNFQRVPIGTSGGVTILGVLGSITGACVLAISGWGILPNPPSQMISLMLITACGFLAGLTDSYLGATIQIQYQCPACQSATEKQTHCGDNITYPISGVTWISNDVVNFINTLSAILFMYLGTELFL